MYWCPFCGQHHEIESERTDQRPGFRWFRCPKMDDVFVIQIDEPGEDLQQLAHEIELAIEWPTFIDLTE